MDFLTRNKFLITLIIILIVLNISSLITVWLLSSERNEHVLTPRRDTQEQRDAMDFIQFELGLDSLQEMKIDNFRDYHFKERREADKYILDLRREIIRETIKPEPDTFLMQKYAGMIGAKQKELELLVYDHFKRIKSVLNPGQVKKFDLLMHEMIERNPTPPQDKPELNRMNERNKGEDLNRANSESQFRQPPKDDQQRKPPPRDDGRKKPPPRRDDGRDNPPRKD